MDIRIIHEDKDLIVIGKPAGIVVHGALHTTGGQGGRMKSEMLTDWLCERYPEIKTVGDDQNVRPGIVHRLDKNTSGVMVVARNQKTFDALKQLFKSREIEKTYLALVAGTPKKLSGTIDAPIGRLMRNRTKRGIGRGITAARAAVTSYRVLERFNGWSLLRVRPKTGRMHQIRVHLASIGHPVAGDTVYGGGRAHLPGLERQFLHAFSLSFSFPPGRRWHFEAALPDDLDRVLRELRRLRRNA